MAYKILIALGAEEKAEILAELIRDNAYRLRSTEAVILKEDDRLPQMCQRHPEAYALVFDDSVMEILADVRRARRVYPGLTMVLVADDTKSRFLKRMEEELSLVWIPAGIKNFHLRFVDLMRTTLTQV